MPFLTPNQQRQSTEGRIIILVECILTDVCGRCVGGGRGCAGIAEFRGRCAAAAAAAAVAAGTVVAASAVVVVLGARAPRRVTAQRCHVTRRTTVLHTAYN